MRRKTGLRLLLLLLLLCLFLTACEPAPAKVDPFYLPYGDEKWYVGMAEADFLTAVGNDYPMTETASCAGEGVDRVYVLPSVRVYVFASVGGDASVTGIVLTDDGVKTAEGIRIGMTCDEVTALMGEPLEKSESVWRYTRGESLLTFSVRDGNVVSVSYSVK